MDGSVDHSGAGRWLPGAALVGVTLLGGALILVNLSRLPPGAYLDETLPSILARDSLATGRLQIFYPESFGGYHPTIVAIAIVGRWLMDGSPYALRYGVALWSVLTFPLTFFGLRAIFQLDESEARATWLALAGTLSVALTVGFIITSRTGFESILPAPVAVATFLFLTKGLRTGRRRYLILAGGALGLAQYTAISARLLPLAVATAMVWLALSEGRAAWRARAGELALVAGAAVAMFAPLGYYFFLHPNSFILRAVATSGAVRSGGLAGLPAVLLNGAVHTLGGLVLPGWGDILSRQNVPGRPLFDAFLALCLGLGLVVAARHPRRRSHIFLLSWAALQLVPAIVTLENNAPHFSRLIVAVPALGGLAALGVRAIYTTLRPWGRWLAGGVLAAGLLYSLAATADALFLRWPSVPDLYEAFLVGDWRAANLALDYSRSQDVYLSPQLISDGQHAAFDLLLRGGPVRDFPGPACLLFQDRPTRQLTYVLFMAADRRTANRVTALFPRAIERPPILHEPNPYPDYRILEVPAGAEALPPQHPANALFGDRLRLVGYDLSAPAVRAGETVTVTLYWQALQPALPDYSMFVHVYLPGGDVGAAGVSPQPVAQNDGAPCEQSFPTPRWAVGETVVDERALTVPPDYRADRAPLGLGVYAWPSLERLPVAGQASLLPGDRVSLGEIKVVK